MDNPASLGKFTQKLLLEDDTTLLQVLKGSLKRLRILIDIAGETQSKIYRYDLLCL